MRKQVFEALITKLKTIEMENGQFIMGNGSNPYIRHFDLWNNNLVYIEENEAFLMPAVFIEFKPISWRQQLGGRRDATFQADLHVITQRNMPTGQSTTYKSRALLFFDLLNAINLCLHGLKGEGFGAITIKSSVTNHDFDELIESIETIECFVTDTSACKTPQTANATAIVEAL